MDPRTHATGPLRRKLLWLAGVRAVAVSLLLGAAILFRIGGAVPDWPVDPFFALIAATFFVTGVCAFTVRYVERWPWIVDAQLGADAVLVSLLVMATGGLDSFFAWLYVLPIIGASIVQYRRGGLMVASFSVLAFTAIVVGQYTGAFPVWSLASGARAPLPAGSEAFYRVGLAGIGFLAVAVLVGHLAEGWRRADARLAEASTEIADLQAFNQHVIDSLTGGLATTTRDRRVLTFNHAAQQITALNLLAVRGQDVCRVLQLPGALHFALEHATGMIGTQRFEYEFARADGVKLLMGISAAPLRGGPGDEPGFVFTFQDVTELKRRDREASSQKRLAAIGEMAAGIAHEIRNPLASMTGSIQILRQELPLSDEQAQLMDIVLRESERLNETITNFLAYARPQKRHLQRVDLRRVLEETAALLRNSVERRADHTIDVVADAADAGFEADEGQIRQVVWNLATNGLRAMPRGGVLRLRLQVERSGLSPACTIAVEDEGVGIDEATRDTLFQPFKSGFTAGTGLGLAIVHRVVSDYGGLVRVSSKVGEGTTVTVRLPLSHAMPAALPADVA